MPTLSDFERLSLLNQYRILAKVEKTDNYSELIEALEYGDVANYHKVFAQLREEMPESETDFVLDTLNMYLALYLADKTIFFPGFDGNNEGQYRSFARRQIEHPDMWGEQKQFKKDSDGWNTHTPMLAIYRRQLAVWQDMGRKHKLSPAEVTSIQDA